MAVGELVAMGFYNKTGSLDPVNIVAVTVMDCCGQLIR